MRVHWIVPGSPVMVLADGKPDLHFPGTSGWCWEEACWAGEHTGPNDILALGLGYEPEVVVISPEGMVPPLLTQVLALPPAVTLLLRCVGAPADNDVWAAVGAICPRLARVAVLSDVERRTFEPWSRVRGFKGTVTCIPLGARVLPGLPTSLRQGVAFLGRPFWREKGVGLLLEAAKQLPRIPFFFATPRHTNVELNQPLLDAAKQLPNVALTTCGISGRASLLQAVRIAAVAGETDWQWLPGTEIRGAHGVGLARWGTPLQEWNGNGLDYFKTVSDLVDAIRDYHVDDGAFESEAARQHGKFLAGGFDSETVGKKLWAWVNGA